MTGLRAGKYKIRIPVFILILIFSVVLISGCGGGRKWEDVSADVAWAKILKKYEKKRYLDAVERLEIFLINHSGSPMMDSAQFLLAESHYKMKEYLISASEYEKLVLQFPQSPLVEQSEYNLGMSYYKMSPKYSLDQVYSERAIDAFQIFIEDFPNSKNSGDAMEMIGICRGKLARKEYESGRLYHKVKEYPSARIYYGIILDNYYDTEYAPKALFYRAETWQSDKDWVEAINDYSSFLDKYEDHEWSGKALKALNRITDDLREKEEETKVGKT